MLCGGLPHQTVLADLVRPLVGFPDTELVACDTASDPVGPAADLLVGLGERLAVRDQIRVTRPDATQVRTELSEASILVSGERAGLMHLEAMATGVPVIATSAQVAEAVSDGVTGLHLLDPAQRALGRTVWELLANHTARYAMALARVDRALTRYHPTRIAAEVDRLRPTRTVAILREGWPATTPRITRVSPNSPLGPS